MDRLETCWDNNFANVNKKFTFQYGQIRNKKVNMLNKKRLLHLHSSMDRLETYKKLIVFILYQKIYIPVWIDQKHELELGCFIASLIYIPVWIDQKQCIYFTTNTIIVDLHSSMDRLETVQNISLSHFACSFTFQYGQIRNLASKLGFRPILRFTFQYGQIRNVCLTLKICWHFGIYIPVWIDQKPISNYFIYRPLFYLHSSMDRLETEQSLQKQLDSIHLHSSMDRLETNKHNKQKNNIKKFTFQYGQIRNNFYINFCMF